MLLNFELSKVGFIDHAVVDLADLTIVCGENNTGKTYVTYAIYGFLRNWRRLLRRELRMTVQQALRRSSQSSINLHELFSGRINSYLSEISGRYTKILPSVFASNPEFFDGARFVVSVAKELDLPSEELVRSFTDASGERTIASMRKAKNSNELEVLEMASSPSLATSSGIQFVVDAIADIVFAPYLPDVTIASAERTGAAIFRKELDFARTRLIEALASNKPRNLSDPYELMDQLETGYALPVRDNVDFVRGLEDIDKLESPLVRACPSILKAFEAVIGGSYRIIKDKGIYYQPQSHRRLRLSMSESSSSVRALLDIGFYIRCKAKPGDLLIIDEPELNLHPVNQRAFARLIALLCNSGVHVFMTTHSDYVIKELNTLIMFAQDTQHTQAVQKKFGYRDEEKLDPQKIKLFITCSEDRKIEGRGKRVRTHTLRKATIHAGQGIEVETFDKTIELMNEIQSELLFGGEDAS